MVSVVNDNNMKSVTAPAAVVFIIVVNDTIYSSLGRGVYKYKYRRMDDDEETRIHFVLRRPGDDER